MRERIENMVVVAYGAPVEVLALAGLLRDESIRYIIANNQQLPKGELERFVGSSNAAPGAESSGRVARILGMSDNQHISASSVSRTRVSFPDTSSHYSLAAADDTQAENQRVGLTALLQPVGRPPGRVRLITFALARPGSRSCTINNFPPWGLVMLSLLSWLVTGLIVGLIARALVPGKQDIGTMPTIVLGVIGAVIGGLISSFIWPTWTNDPDVNQMWPGWLMSIAGGVLVLAIYVAIAGRRDVAYRAR
jgi:uncharacterized membrane protein YeaQ/YmgE (transglycosylase-associated protein family)